MRCYSHLSDDEREQIGLAKAVGHSIGAIAKAIGRPKSTVSRELLRNKCAERSEIAWWLSLDLMVSIERSRRSRSKHQEGRP